MMKYRKKSAVIEAVRWNGINKSEIEQFAGDNVKIEIIREGDAERGIPYWIDCSIKTPEGVMTARIGDYIIKDANGEFYPCKPDIFEKTYDMAETLAEKLEMNIKRGMTWIRYEQEKPPIGQEVLAYHPDWVNEDFNPEGIRIGFWDGEEDFTSAHWWAHQDCYMTISHSECDDNPSFSEETKSCIEPELWISLDYLTIYLPKQGYV